MNSHIVSIGDLVVDLIMPASLPILPGQHQHPAALRVEPGGAGSFMIVARRLGMDVSALGAIGYDLFGKFLRDVLDAEGVNTAGIQVGSKSETTSVVVLSDQDSGEHVFIGHVGEGPATVYGDVTDDIVRSASALFVQGYTLCEQRVTRLAHSAIGRARVLGVPVYLDVGPRMANVSPELARWGVQNCDVLMLTEDEIALVSEGRGGDAALAYLLSLGPNTLVVKLGANGCFILDENHAERVPGFRVAVVDTVGAGDCFDAAFVAGQLRGLSLRDAALLANAAGAAAVQKSGAGRGAPTCDEINVVLQSAGIRWQAC